MSISTTRVQACMYTSILSCNISDPNISAVGLICAVETKLVAAASFLDKEHDDPECLPVNDNNYVFLGESSSMMDKLD